MNDEKKTDLGIALRFLVRNVYTCTYVKKIMLQIFSFYIFSHFQSIVLKKEMYNVKMWTI